ncbi:MAG: threonine/serine exporter family protein [Lachnospiraceae bacterium]|nr:threonine/serine exporter family protein [Lachnospiraceae bacterium]
MDYERVVKGILDIGESMLQSGAENYRLEDSLYRMCKSYGFLSSDVYVIPSNLQITVETPDGRFITQIRHIENMDLNFDRLDYLNNLSRYVCQNTPDAPQLQDKYNEVLQRPKQHPAAKYFAGIMGGTGFAVFFGCDFMDAVVAIIVSLMIVICGEWLHKRENNMIVYNMILSFLAEFVILASFHLGISHHPERIMIGIVMLLISALGTTNGIRDLMQKDIISGSVNIIHSMLGAAGIAFGTALALLMFGDIASAGFVLNDNIPIQLISCTIACTGFALWFKIRGRQVLYSSVGAFFTWGIYLIVYHFNPSNFFATLVASIFVAFYAFIMSRINKAPSTIFLTASVFPLIPGPNLYYLMYGCVSRNISLAFNEAIVLFATCLAIAFGFIIIDVVSRIIMHIMKRDYHIRKNSSLHE